MLAKPCFKALIPSTCFLLAMASIVAAQTVPLTGQEAHRRAEALLKQMTVEEKAGQMNQAAGIVIPGLGSEKPDAAIAKGQVGSVLWQFDVKELNRMQHLAVEKSRLHIPLIIGFDVIHGYRTVFPVPLAMASSWDPAVEEAAQHHAAQDARCRHPVDLYPDGGYSSRCTMGPDCGRRGRGSLPGRGHGCGTGAWLSG